MITYRSAAVHAPNRPIANLKLYWDLSSIIRNHCCRYIVLAEQKRIEKTRLHTILHVRVCRVSSVFVYKWHAFRIERIIHEHICEANDKWDNGKQQQTPKQLSWNTLIWLIESVCRIISVCVCACGVCCVSIHVSVSCTQQRQQVKRTHRVIHHSPVRYNTLQSYITGVCYFTLFGRLGNW